MASHKFVCRFSTIILYLICHVPMALCLSLAADGDNLLPGWKRACVDYSAANEYISVHYGMDNYFAGAQQTTTEVDVRNARNGVYNFDQQGYIQPKLSDCGFQLISRSPKNHDDSNKDYDASQLIRTIDWNNPNDVTKHYISSYLRNEVIPSCFDQDEILCFAFWNPTVRGEDLPMSSDRSANVTKTAPVAATVHIDTDINACANSSELVHLLLSDKNRVHEDDADFDENQFIHLIEQGHRFVLLNFWQTILPEPVQRAPLGVLSVKYQKSKNIAAAAFPDAYPDLEKSLWYCFPDMIPQECLVFKQYDRDASYASDIWHCGLSSIQTSITGPAKKRKNFDVRAFVILKEQVSKTTNRFVPTRRKSELTLDESECFCSEQAQRRMEGDQT